MTVTSYGYSGTLGAGTWAQGEDYRPMSVQGDGDLLVTPVSGQRAVSVAGGSSYAAGVTATTVGADVVNLPTPTNGQWFLIVERRDWDAGTTTHIALPGPTTSATTPTATAYPRAAPAGLQDAPGTQVDLPLAWAWVNGTSTLVTLADCRRWADSDPIAVASGTGMYLLPGQRPGQLALRQIDGLVWQLQEGVWTAVNFEAFAAVSGDTGWLFNSDSGLGGAAGWTFNSGRVRVVGGVCHWAANLTRKSGQPTLDPKTGSNVTNTPVVDFPSKYTPSQSNGQWTNNGGSASGVADGYVSSGGYAVVTSAASQIAAGYVMDIVGYHLL